MKKIIAIIMSIILLMGSVSILVSAEDYEPTEEEKAAGFLFGYVFAVIKEEYTFKFDEFTPEMFSSELVESVEELFPYNPDKEYSDFRHILQINVKNPSEENIIKLYMLLKDHEYIDELELPFLDNYMPIYPDSGEKIPRYSGAYTPIVECIGDRSQTTFKNMLNNPYYKIYYNQLLAYSVSLYHSTFKYIGDFDYIDYYVNENIQEAPRYVTLILNFVDVTTEEKSVREQNLEILGKYFNEEDILYVGDTVNAAIVCVDSSDGEILKGMQELEFIGDAFFNDRLSGGLLCVTGEFVLGDVRGKSDPDGVPIDYADVTAADARYILRYSAGLEKSDGSKRFYYCADVDFDGKITSADARLALRTAAGLEQKYNLIFGYSVSWYDTMIEIIQ